MLQNESGTLIDGPRPTVETKMVRFPQKNNADPNVLFVDNRNAVDHGTGAPLIRPPPRVPRSERFSLRPRPPSRTMKIQPLFPRPQTVSQQIAEILRRGLDDGIWKCVLPGEIELSRTLQVSRMALRASLATLTAEGRLSVSGGGRKRTILVRPNGDSKRRASRLIVLLTAVPIEHMTMLHILQVDGLRERFLQDG